MASEFRNLPSVDKLLADERIQTLAQTLPHDRLVAIIRGQLEEARQSVASGKSVPPLDRIVVLVILEAQEMETATLRPIVNATGVILHTNLGRAPVSKEAIEAMEIVSKGYSNLEFDLESGARGSRQVHIESLLCELTGAEAALVVNNNAAAVLLGLTALAKRKEVIVSRGQAVEIGGGFRIPDVMRQSGAKLVEVGTTNCTYIADYEKAIVLQIVALLRVHSSNFRVVGFTNEVGIAELVELGKKHDIPVFDDLGSGCFLDTTKYGLTPEPMVQQSVASGAALTFFSGDKLVGGPQAGIIVGKKEYIAKLKKHPLARAVRIDKIRLAGLVATLIHYLKGEAEVKVPVWRMISEPLDDIERRAKKWAKALGEAARVIGGESMVGGGSLPGGTLPTKLVAIGSRKERAKAQEWNGRLRQLDIPIIGRISEDILLLDPRSVLPEEDEGVVKALKKLVK